MPKLLLSLEVFFFKSPVQLWNHGPDLSIHNTVLVGWNKMKIDSQHAVKKVLDLRKIKYSQNSEVNSNFSVEIYCKHNLSLKPVNFHYSAAFYSTF